MSGPVSSADAPPAPTGSAARPACVELVEGRATEVGGTPVTRLLPRRIRRTIGAWCFVDHFGPAPVDRAAMQIGPHPHTGLATVTWILEGEVLHRDSLGSEQPIRPGQLNLMTAGRGVAHAEETPDGLGGSIHGFQLWVAQPDATRSGEPAFEHHGELPRAELGPGATATVLVGRIGPAASAARADTPLLGADLLVERGATVPLTADLEHGLILVDGDLAVDGHRVASGAVAYLGHGRDQIELRSDAGARVLLLGGAPFEEEIVMWWNFVARTTDEIDRAIDDWEAGTDRFGPVASSLAAMPAPVRPGRS